MSVAALIEMCFWSISRKNWPMFELRVSAIADDDGGHAHAQEVLGLGRVGGLVGVRVDINESWRDDHPCSVNLHLRPCIELADGGNVAIFHRHVGEESGIASAVHHATVPNDEVERLGLGRAEPTQDAGDECRRSHKNAL
jgi:hypothetical protein